jgi:DNA-binding response OmpR family regulator/tetratricopeptide (TPR) repeat protein
MPYSVLIAEPHSATLEHLREVLVAGGYQVLVASTAEQALELFGTERPDAVLQAVDLPRIRGATLGKHLRAGGGAHVPLLAVDKAHLGKARGVGAILDLMANAYLADATRRDELLNKLAQLIAGAQSAPRPQGGIAATLARPPVATGLMKERTLPALLYSCWRLARDGVVVVVHRDLTRRVFLLKGAPVAFDSSSRQDSVAGYLVGAGLVTPEQHDRALELLRDPGVTLGTALVAAGAAAEGEPIASLLRDGVSARIAQACSMGEGRYCFYAGAEFATEVAALEVPALAPLYDGARRHWPARAFAAALSPYLRQYPRRSTTFSRDLAALRLSTADLKLALELDGRHTLREVLSQSRDLRHTLALLWFLSLTGAVEHQEAPVTQPDHALGAFAEAPRRRKKPLPAEQLRSLHEDAVRLLTASYFGTLGLDVSADGEDVERAYHEAATRFHPDTFAEFELGPIEGLLASMQDKLAAAYRVLSDDAKRKAYVGYLLSRADAPRLATANVEAEITLKRGERLMKQGDWRSARLAFEQAVSLNPREPEYYGYLAWATFEASIGPRRERARQALRLVRKALAMNPTLQRLQVIAAILCAESGDPADARRQLLKILKASPGSELARKALQGLARKRQDSGDE